MKRWRGILLALVLAISLAAPQNVQAASTVKVIQYGVTKTYKKRMNKIYVNNKKVSVKTVPIFMKSGAYMGVVTRIFSNSSLKVKKKSSNGQLTLTYGDNVLVMKEKSRKATCNGETVTLGAAPMRITYASSGYYRWVVPLKSVCTRLGISYKISSGVIRISGAANTTSTDKTSTDKTAAEEQTTQSKTSTTTSKKAVLVLDAGHGGTDTGATGNGYAEKNMTLAIVTSAKSYFDKDTRFKVYYTRTGDTYPSLSDRAKLANNNNADLFLCVHINSASASATGTETLYSKSRNTDSAKNGITSLDFATAMQKAVQKTTGFKNRGLVDRPNLYVLKHTNMPACLVEYGFISNSKEAKTMNANTARYGKELYQAVVDYMVSKGKIK